MEKLTSYESKVLEEIREWENEEPGVLAKTMGFLFSWVPDCIVPETLISSALKGADAAAEFFTDKGDILRDGQVSKIEDLMYKDIELSDEMASSIKKWALAIAAGEGGATGTGGAPAMAADIAFIIPFAIRTIRKIGLCYGFECNGREGRNIVLNILTAAGANTVKEKTIAIANLTAIKVMVQKTTWKELERLAAEQAAKGVAGKESFIMAIKHAAKQLGINLTKRKALQAVPIIGAGVGAIMNASFLDDVSDAATNSFRKLWLAENKKID